MQKRKLFCQVQCLGSLKQHVSLLLQSLPLPLHWHWGLQNQAEKSLAWKMEQGRWGCVVLLLGYNVVGGNKGGNHSTLDLDHLGPLKVTEGRSYKRCCGCLGCLYSSGSSPTVTTPIQNWHRLMPIQERSYHIRIIYGQLLLSSCQAAKSHHASFRILTSPAVATGSFYHTSYLQP